MIALFEIKTYQTLSGFCFIIFNLFILPSSLLGEYLKVNWSNVKGYQKTTLGMSIIGKISIWVRKWCFMGKHSRYTIAMSGLRLAKTHSIIDSMSFCETTRFLMSFIGGFFFPLLIMLSPHSANMLIYLIIIFFENIDLDSSSLNNMVPEVPCVVYATKCKVR